MSALLVFIDPLIAFSTSGVDLTLAAGGSQRFVDLIRNFIGPIFLLAIGIAAMSFLFQRQVTQFLQFAALAVGIAIFFYYPGLIKSVAELFSNAF